MTYAPADGKVQTKQNADYMTRRKAEGARLAPTTTGGIDKRTLFVLAGDSEVVEELAPAARH